MADVKISELPVASALDGTELVPIVQGGVTKRTTVSGLGGTITVGLVPHAGGGQANGTQMTTGYNAIANPANDFDSMQLPPAVAPAVVVAFTTGPVSKRVSFYSKNGTGNTINGADPAANFEVGIVTNWPNTGAIAIFVCASNGAWFSNAADGS